MYIEKSQKIVIKIGSSILVNQQGVPKKAWLETLVKDIKYLIKRKKKNEQFKKGRDPGRRMRISS